MRPFGWSLELNTVVDPAGNIAHAGLRIFYAQYFEHQRDLSRYFCEVQRALDFALSDPQGLILTEYIRSSTLW